MTDKSGKRKFTKVNVLAIYEILGGLFGLVVTVSLITTLSTFNFLFLVIILIPLLLYGHSVFSGILIFKNPLLGLKHSRVNQILQLINFSFLGYAFQYISGLYFSVGIDITEALLFKFDLGTSTWRIAFSQDTIEKIVNFNILALLLIIFIERLIKRIESVDLDKTTFIGQIND